MFRRSAAAGRQTGLADGAEELLKLVAGGKVSARLLQEKGVEVRLNEAKVPQLKERVAQLTAGLPPNDVIARLG